ncbi:MAG: aminopeptidase P N-terminal domain-containing protein [Thermoanaerobaculia bacterium]
MRSPTATRRLFTHTMLFLAGASVAQAAVLAPAPTAAFFAAHRASFVARLPAGAVAVVRTAPETSVETTPDPYRQNSDFWYLTGFSEPNAVAVLRPWAAEGERYILFVAPRDPAKETWTGYRAGVEGAKREFGAEAAYSVEEFDKQFPELLVGSTSLAYLDGGDAPFRDRLLTTWNGPNANATEPRPAAEAGPIVHELRLIKDATEVALIRRAAELSAEAHVAALREVKPGGYEYDIKAAMVSTCLHGGAGRMAYPPIVGSGRNSVILHYEPADKRLDDGGMIVNDTACEYGMYAADVTRSYPVSGKFSPDQRAIYEIVLAAQKAAIAAVKPGIPYRTMNEITIGVVVDGLLRLGILTGNRDELIESGAQRKFYPHGAGHWIGLNVHDPGSYGFPAGVPWEERYRKANTVLRPGMIFTVEPGIYIPEGSTEDKRWWNIGVRIEDEILVTEAGGECLSCAAPREIAELEKALAAKSARP